MGRWAQRQRGGGGPPLVLVQMIVADLNLGTPTHVLVTYNRTVIAGNFTPESFHNYTSGRTGISVTQSAPTVLDIEFDDAAAQNDTLTYDGTVTGVMTPQETNIN